MNEKKKYILIVVLSLMLFISYAFFGMFIRDRFLDESKPFPTWTYTSPNEFVNVFTSWDSGFYHDLALNGYPKLGDSVPSASIEVPSRSWVKVFTGAGLVGESKFGLPYSEDGEKVTNTLILMNASDSAVNVPMYHVYEGIPYCSYTGDIDFERDVLPANESLTNPQACGTTACTHSYVTYYDVLSRSAVYQEVFTSLNSQEPSQLVGSERPSGYGDKDYVGFGCKSIQDFDITEEAFINYEKQFTPYPFMPTYSLLARSVSNIVGDTVLAGILVSVIFTIISGLILYELLKIDFDDRLSFFATLGYLLFPFAFYNYAFLAVSTFNLLFFLTLYLVKKKHYLASIPFAMMLVYSNLLGLLVLIPLFYIYKSHKNDSKSALKPFVITTLVLLALVLLHILYLQSITGDWLVLFTSRKPWYGAAQSFVGSIVNYFIIFNKYNIIEVLAGVLLFVLGFIGYTTVKQKDNKKMGSDYASLLSFLILIPILNGSLAGILQYSLVLIPVFLLLGDSASKKSYGRMLLILLGLSSLVFFAMWTLSLRFVV